ncbi:hypothetical protein MKW94_018557 [Papaver nudicaule]|uniref:Origin recognition complex subunit 5 n=1 Tax=Papaver nudicaule TaxID=74823 RepID=A0AA41VAH2_PAPNU|nr:hypothetical protein [Papaver nudicaule]
MARKREGTPPRTTRFSALKSCSALNDLVLGGEEPPISRYELLSSLPGREPQILELLDLLGPVNSPMLPLFLYGDASTGKTSSILQIFRYLKRPFIYSSCRTCYTPGLLFGSILNQLLLHRRNAGNGYMSAKRCERPADFINFLRDGVTKLINCLGGNTSKLDSNKLGRGTQGRMIYFIFDSMELVRKWVKHSEITSMLFKLNEILKMPEVGFIFISNSSLDNYHLNTGFVEPVPVHFPGYTVQDVTMILKQDPPNQNPLYQTFLKDAGVVSSFFKVTRRVDELPKAFTSMFQKYCEPLRDMGLVPTGFKEQKQYLYQQFRHRISPALNEIFKVPSFPNTLESEANEVTTKRKSPDAEAIEFHMPVSTKLLLISSYLASWNPAADDGPLFNSVGDGENRKRKRKVSEISKLKKENAEQKLIMKGPGTFSLERMLAIFQCVTVAKSFENEEQVEDENVLGRAEVGEADVLLQLSTLCNANFISKSGSCPLESSTRYRCVVSEEFVMQVIRHDTPFPYILY